MDHNKECLSDKDCDNNLCAFNESEMKHYCINNKIEDLYYGCLDINQVNKLSYIDSNNEIDSNDYLNCIQFSRRQQDADGMDYNYMLYKPKRKSFVDITTINIYLKCHKEVLAVIPHEDYFNKKCDTNNENCEFISKDNLKKFIQLNIDKYDKCNTDIHLEIEYSCENEGIKKRFNIPVDLNNNKPVKFKLVCPINPDDDKLRAKCSALYFNKYKTNNRLEDLVDTNIDLNSCKTPIFQVPRIVQNSDKYKKIKDKTLNNEIQNYDKEISNKIDDLKKIKAEKYMKLKNITGSKQITYEDAMKAIERLPLEKLLNSSKENWNIFNNYDAAEKLFTDNDENPNLTYYGKVYTLEEAIKISNDLNEYFFVWYNNSYELDNFASKLYFINIYRVEPDQLEKSNWVKHNSVTTCMFKLDVENFDTTPDRSPSYNDLIKVEDETDTLIKNDTQIINKYADLLKLNISNNEMNKNVYQTIINKLDSKNTTYGQAINMNNYETTINNTILTILFIILTISIITFFGILVYYNNLTAGKIKLFGR